MNFSNLSPETLHIGQISGGLSRAHKYPQTLQRQTGFDSSVEILNPKFALIFSLSSGDGLLSGIDCNSFSPLKISPEMYNPQ